MESKVLNVDCMEYMRTLQDKFFDLAIADPPYGIGMDGKIGGVNKRVNAKPREYTQKDWDNNAPGKDFFDELIRISSNQIIWGANHFISRIPYDSHCWIVWDKRNTGNFADCELAWTSFQSSVRLFSYRWNGMLQENMAHKEDRIHPTQKPVALYAWLMNNYATGGGQIFDPMMGSQSSRIAAYKMGFDYVGCELDKEYFDKGCERFDRECRGITTADDGRKFMQTSLF